MDKKSKIINVLMILSLIAYIITAVLIKKDSSVFLIVTIIFAIALSMLLTIKLAKRK